MTSGKIGNPIRQSDESFEPSQIVFLSGGIFPCSLKIIPCSGSQGILPQRLERDGVLGATLWGIGPIIADFPVVFPVTRESYCSFA